MDESSQSADNGEAREDGRKALRILQVHAAHQKKNQAAREKLSAEVRLHLQRMGAPPTEETEWPALASANAIVSRLPPALQDEVLDKLPELIREQLVELLFSFASIPQQHARTIQRLIQTIDKRTLAIALIGCEEPIHHAVTTNMSKRAVTMLDEDIESLVKAGELSTRDVREARTEVSSALYGLHESGDLFDDVRQTSKTRLN